jgi:HlyD family secretion protein
MKAKHWGAGVVAIAVVAAAAFVVTRPAPVALTTAATAPLAQTLVFSGRVASAVRVELGATVTGRVAEVLVGEGDPVRRGQPLARLESEEVQAQLAQAQAALRLARARLDGQREVARPSSDAALSQALANLEAAQREARRSEDLLGQGYVSIARVDETRRAVQVAQAQVDAARAASRAQANTGTETEQARLRVEEAGAALALAQARLAQTRLASPSDGRIVARHVEPGQIVQPGRRLFDFVATGVTQLLAGADERFLGQLAAGQRATIVADAFPEQAFEAVVRSISPGVDAQRGTVEVKFDVPEPPPFLREDMTVSVSVEVARKPSAITLPASAVIGAGTDGRVRTLVDGRVAEQPVRVGLRTFDRLEIVSGLESGAQVLLDPLAIEPGQRARAARAGETIASGPGATGSARGGGGSGGGGGPAAAMGAAAGAR